jgi:hypothetical protein
MGNRRRIKIRKKVKKALGLNPDGKVDAVVDGDRARRKPLGVNILDIGGSVEIPRSGKPSDFRRIREEVRTKVARKAAQGR